MEAIYLVITIVGILLALPVLGAIVVLVIGFINRFRNVPFTPKKPKQLFKAGDSMRILRDIETFDD
ncbi:MAG TPA: hypothetical protein VFM05_01995 [Candidatus Saccharimonadales bacterium]|nr:hypothetical protein [Candidatus Saccharimonadales bacterium]